MAPNTANSGSAPATGSVWNPDNITDVGESLGLTVLPNDVLNHLTRDVEFRMAQIIEEAIKCMRHAKRTALWTQDINNALKILELEPLYGYESSRPLKFGEAPNLQGSMLYFVEDDELELEKLINTPLPKIPREMTFTAHWLAVEGVQPSIPQNPPPSDASRGNPELLPKGNQHLAATSGADNLTAKPLVRHILSKELQLYFDHVSKAVMDETNESYRLAALSSLRSDPGLHQLVPYFVQWVSETVTHSLKSLFKLEQALYVIDAMVTNPHLHVKPYLSSLVPPIITCLVGKRLGQIANAQPQLNGEANGHSSEEHVAKHYELRRLAASTLELLCRNKYTQAVPTLKPRLARTFLKYITSPNAQPLGVYYGAILGMQVVSGEEGIRVLLVPNLSALEEPINESLAEDDESKRNEAQALYKLVESSLMGLSNTEIAIGRTGSDSQSNEMDVDSGDVSDERKDELVRRFGQFFGERLAQSGQGALIQTLLRI